MPSTSVKTVKFASHHVRPILEGQKTATWRLNDDKDLSIGDPLRLYDSGSNSEFAHAIVTAVYIKQLRELTEEEKKADYSATKSLEEICDDMVRHYGAGITADTTIKIVNFQTVTDI